MTMLRPIPRTKGPVYAYVPADRVRLTPRVDVRAPQSSEPHNLFPPGLTPLPDLLSVVSRECGIPASHIMSRWRKTRVVRARAILSYVAHIHFNLSLPRIGRFIGRDHSSVLHAVQTVTQQRERFEPELSAVLAQCPSKEGTQP